jgi:DNA polymerase (family 10)
MPAHNAAIAAIFREIADLLDLENANPFRIRAYRNAARTIEELDIDLAGVLAEGKELPRLPGIGTDLTGKIREIVETGRCQTLTHLRRSTPPGLLEFLSLPALGSKRAKAIYDELGIHTLRQLHRAAKDRRLRTIAGIGQTTEARILEAIEARAGRPVRYKLSVAAQTADMLSAYLMRAPGLLELAVAGSYRRAKETVGDLDIVVSAAKSNRVMEWFVAYDEITRVIERGSTRASATLRSGIQVDLRLVPKESFGAALVYFTGSKAHNIAIRRRAQQRGLKISEYGVFRGARKIAGDTEESVYRSIGLPFIAPELREDQGEIAAAEAHRLPVLVELPDLTGDLHCHSKATDGRNTIREMAEAAHARGLAYIAMTEHSRHLTVAHGLDARRLLRQIDEIDRLNGQLSGIAILKGIEVDILEDGSLDLPDDVLGRLDLVIGAVHSGFNLSRERQTRRVLAAMDRPHFSMLAHPSGRLIPDRQPFDLDMALIIRHARERGCFLELNAHPDRLDLLDIHCRFAKEQGVLVAVNSDAHSIYDFANLRHGIGQARRGWLAKSDVLNARPLQEVRMLLNRTMRS